MNYINKANSMVNVLWWDMKDKRTSDRHMKIEYNMTLYSVKDERVKKLYQGYICV